MNLKQDIKDTAKQLFEGNETIKVLVVNKKGEFFTSMNMARNSVKTEKDLLEIPRSSVLTAPAPKGDKKKEPFVLPTVEELKAKGDKLPAYVKALNREQLFQIAELIELTVKGNPKNVEIADSIVEELTKAEEKSE